MMLTIPPSARPVFGAETVVHYAEFLHRFLRRRGALDAAGRIDKIRAVHRDFVAEGAHAAERDLRRSYSVKEVPRLVRLVATPGVKSAKSVKRRPLMGRDWICCVPTTWLISATWSARSGLSLGW